MAGDEKRPMVAWFDPRQLIDTAIRVVISTVFGQFADRREAIAASNPISDVTLDARCDYRARHPDGDFWFDYVADVGDGWNPTYAIARLLAAGELTPEGLPRGSLLVMGGDEVYPTAKSKEYEDRLIYPYDEAWRPGKDDEKKAWPDDARPDLFAVPGNHDWYDGLKTFFHFFCRRTISSPGEAEVDREGRRIGGRQTHQTRSYFALRLPHGWWLWGTDNQLKGYIDQPQIDFFQYVAKTWMEEGSKLILCTGTPDWQYVEKKGEGSFTSHSYLERLATDAVHRGHKLRLVLSGDNHHYVRYREGDLNYITCGGGGAFLHPTHKLEDQTFESDFPPPGQAFERGSKKRYTRKFEIANKLDGSGKERDEKAVYPDAAVSRRLARGNIIFAFRNWQLTATLAALYLFFIWLLDFNARVSGHGGLTEMLREGSYRQALANYGWLVGYSPWTVMLCIVAFAGYFYFADATGLRKWLLAIAHWLLQTILVTLVIGAILHWLAPPQATGFGYLAIIAGLMLLAAILSAFVSATVVGLYLWAVLAWFGLHPGHFSSLKVQNHKCFLRLHIDRAGVLRVYPIGLDVVPGDRGETCTNPKLNEHLIEGPIRIM
jgi:hypothetical protein